MKCLWSEDISYICYFMNLALNPEQRKIVFHVVVLYHLELHIL